MYYKTIGGINQVIWQIPSFSLTGLIVVVVALLVVLLVVLLSTPIII
jgi:hypothetical protein